MTPTKPLVTDERLDRLVRQLLAERADDIGATALPAGTMAAVVASHVRHGPSVDRRPLILLAAALVLVFAIGAVAVGSGLVRRTPVPDATPFPAVVPPVEATLPAPSSSPIAPTRVFYTVLDETQVGEDGCTDEMASRFTSLCTSSRIWIADADGGNARELFPRSNDRRSIVDVSADGTTLVYMAPTEVDGENAINAAHLAEVGPRGEILPLRIVSNEVIDDGCEGLCAYDDWFTFSPDGAHVAYVRASRQGDDDYATVIAIQDVASGEVVELDVTRASGRDGYDEAPRWSPDGTRLLFTREHKGVATPERRILDQGVYVVNADGSDLRQLTDTELSGRFGAWSPDGSTIAFTSAVAWLGVDPRTGKRENYNEDSDVYTIRPDGSDVRRLTDFAPERHDNGVPVQQGARVEGWTGDGRIVFSVLRWAQVQGDSTNLPPELWIMDADGANASRIDGTDLARLAAAGCIDCPYAPDSDLPELRAFWRPTPAP